MWINLDRDDRGIAASVGSGIAEKYAPIAIYEIGDLLADAEIDVDEDTEEAEVSHRETGEASFKTIPEVIAWTRQQIAIIAKVKTDAVRLDLKIEY